MKVDLASAADEVWGVTGNFNGLPDGHPWVGSLYQAGLAKLQQLFGA